MKMWYFLIIINPRWALDWVFYSIFEVFSFFCIKTICFLSSMCFQYSPIFMWWIILIFRLCIVHLNWNILRDQIDWLSACQLFPFDSTLSKFTMCSCREEDVPDSVVLLFLFAFPSDVPKPNNLGNIVLLPWMIPAQVIALYQSHKESLPQPVNG